MDVPMWAQVIIVESSVFKICCKNRRNFGTPTFLGRWVLDELLEYAILRLENQATVSMDYGSRIDLWNRAIEMLSRI